MHMPRPAGSSTRRPASARRNDAARTLRHGVLAAAVLVLSACAAAAPRQHAEAAQAGADPATLARHRQLAQRVFDEVLNQGRMGLFDEIYDPAFVKHADGHDFTLAEEIEDARGTRAASSNLVMTVDQMLADGDLVAIRYHGTGTQDGPLFGMPATGRTLNAHGMTIYRFANGRIVEEWTTYNALDVLQQLGLFPPPDAAAR